MSASKPVCKTIPKFVVAHEGKSAFAPFTGQDYAAWSAFVHLVELYAFADEDGRRCSIVAMHHCVMAAQESVWPLFKRAIPGVLDWSDEEPLWRKILDAQPFACAGAS